jgi:hypothetical protein
MISIDRLAHLALTRRRSQVVRQRSAKPLSIGSIPIAASIQPNLLTVIGFSQEISGWLINTP